MNDLYEYYMNPLFFGTVNYAPLQMPGVPRTVLPDAERAPLGYTIDENGMVDFQLYYPNAKSVLVHNFMSEMELKSNNGCWTGKVDLGKGFTSVWLTVDGNVTISPFLPLCFTDNRPMNYVDIPDGTDVRSIRDVSHGTVAQEFLRNPVTGCQERVYVYLPPMYFTESGRRFPVLYLQHGIGENETVWTAQGKINFVMDNLIAEGKAVPMIIVMCNGMMVSADEKESRASYDRFHEFLTETVMPYMQKRYRLAKGQEKQAMAGLSMGSIQTSRTAFQHPGMFSAIGLFSGFLSDPLGNENDHLAPENFTAFLDSGTYFFRAIGDEDPFMPVFEQDDKIVKGAGLTCDRRIYHGNHEWNVWRQCFVDFVQVLFQH